MGLTTLSLMHIVAALEAREPTETIFKRYTIDNRRFVQLIGAALALTFLVTALAPLQRIFDTVSLTSAQWGVCLLGPIVYLAVAELRQARGATGRPGRSRCAPRPALTRTAGCGLLDTPQVVNLPGGANGVAFLRSPCSRWDSAPLVYRRNSLPRNSTLTCPRVRECPLKPALPSGDVLDHLDELVDGVSLPASELDQLPHFLHDGAALGCPGHGDSATAAKLEQPFVLQQPQRAQDGVRVDSEHGREVSCRWESLTGLRLSVCDRTPYLGGDLEIEEVGAVLLVHLDTNQCTSNTSSLVNRWLA